MTTKGEGEEPASRIMACIECGEIRVGKLTQLGEMIPLGHSECQCGGEEFRVVKPEEIM